MKRYLLSINILLFLFLLSHRAGAQTNQTVVNGATTTPVSFPGAGCTYNWTNSTPGIGLPASGTGNIPAFTAVNTGGAPITAAITATPVQTGFAYIANQGDGTVSVINTTTSAVVATIPVGQSPFGVSVSADGSKVYVSNQGSKSVSVISTTTNTVVSTISVGTNPAGLVVSPDGSTVYVTNSADGTVSVINTSTNLVTATISVGVQPTGISITPNGQTVYVANFNDGTISVIKTATASVSASILIGGNPYGLAISPDGYTLYATNGDTYLYLINTGSNVITNKVLLDLSSRARAHGISISPDGRFVYIADGDYEMDVVYTPVLGVLTEIPTPASSNIGISALPDGRAYVTNGSSVSVIDFNTRGISYIGVGNNPVSLGNFVSSGPGCNSSALTFTITVNSGLPPAIVASPATGTISACVGSASVSPNIQQFTVSGSNLTDVITATAPPGFEISFSATGTYGSSVSLSEAGGTTNNTILYLRSAATDPAGNIAGNVVLSSPGATSQNVAVTGIVNPSLLVNSVANQTVNNGAFTTAINFTGSTTAAFNWVNNTPGIGLPASGAGNIPSFKGVNTTGAAVTATVTVAPVPAVFAYVANAGSNTVSVINTSTNTIFATIPVDAQPEGVAVSADGSRVYVTCTASNTVTVINTLTNTVVASIPVGPGLYGLAVSPDGKNVYAASGGNNSIYVINTATNSVTASIPVGLLPVSLCVSADNSKLYVANHSSNTISVINTATNAIISTVPVGIGPEGTVLSPDGNTLYVANTQQNTISVINTNTGAVTATILAGYAPYGISVSHDGKWIYFTNNSNFANGTISVINAATNTVTSVIPVGPQPLAISVSPDDSQLFVTNSGSNTVSVINVAAGAVTGTVSVGLDPVSFGTNFLTPGTGCSGAPATFTITVNSGSSVITASSVGGSISACLGTASTSPYIEYFTVAGSGLTTGITVTAPTDFEVSLTQGNGYGNSLVIPQSGGIANNTTVYVRSAALAPTGSLSGNITLTSAGVTSLTVAVDGTVNALPTVNAVPNQTVNNNIATATVNFTGTGNNIYNWTNNTPAIGLPASGTGNISSFTAKNTSGSPITAIITVTPVSAPFAYVTNTGSQTVSVINTASNKVVATIPVGIYPSAIAISPDGSRVYITNEAPNVITVISTATNTVIGNIPLSSNCYSLCISPDGSRLYASIEFLSIVIIIDTATDAVLSTVGVGTNPVGVAVSPDGSRLYVANTIDNTVSVINTATSTVIATVNTGTGPWDIVVSPDGSRVYVSTYQSNTVTVINALTNTAITDIPVGQLPMALAISPDGSKIYTANQFPNTISVISSATNTVIATIPVAPSPTGVSVSPDGSRIYITDGASNNVLVIDAATNVVTSTVPVGSYPATMGNFITGGTGCTGAPVTFTITVNPAVPTITASMTIGNISACIGSPSASPNIQQFTVSGSGLTGNITAMAPTGFEISLSTGGGYGNTVTLTQTSGAVSNTVIYVRSAASATGSISGNIVLTSPGASPQNVAVTGTINPLPTVNSIANQTVAGGSPTTAINFTGTGSTFTWANDKPGIGLPASGTGNIASFTAVNTGSSPVTATVVVTPTSATGCSGASATFTFTINPAPPETISFKPPPIKTYGDPDFSPAATSSNSNVPITFVSDNTGVASIVNSQIHITGAGTTNITASQAGNNSYGAATPVTQQLIVNKAPLTLTADDKTKTLGQPNPILTFSHTAFAYNEDPSVLTTQPVLRTTATINSTVGQYAISISDAASPNYDIKQLAGTLTINPAPASIVVPNAFTPNGDGINDVWNIQSLIDFPQCLVSVYTRNGSLVFQSRGYGKPWDGTYNGSPVPTGTYYYIIDPQGGLQQLSGYVAVLR